MNKPNIFILKGNYERYREIINKPEFIVGVIFGIISSIPYLNYCCCLLYVLSGVISAHIRSKEGDLSDEEYSDCGGLSGLVAGGITFNFRYYYPGNYGGILLFHYDHYHIFHYISIIRCHLWSHWRDTLREIKE